AELQKQKIIRNSFLIGFVLTLALAFFIFKSYREKKRANIELQRKNEEILQQKEEIESQRDEIEKQKEIAENQRDQIEIQNKVITSSINYAQKIQAAVLPLEETINEIFPDNFILFKPRDIVSGDFYWISKNEGKSILVLADCTGHGVPGAFMSMMGISYLNELVNRADLNDPAEILDVMRINVIQSLHQTGIFGESKDGMDMAILVFDEDFRKVLYAGANLPVYLIRNNELIEFRPDKMPIGFYLKGVMEPFNDIEIELQKGDTLYLFSDGFPDQFGGSEGSKLKYKPFRKLLLNHSQKPLPQQKKDLEDEFNNWKGDLSQIDDVLVMGVRI
ncbi:SpoIIE family protein phosphatase, partial [Bacteroidota bacterium]